MHIKLLFVVLLYLYHVGCHLIYLKLQSGIKKYSSQKLRIWNELATFFLVAIIFLIVIKNQLSWVWGTAGMIIFAIMLMLAINVYKKMRGKNG